MVVGSPGGVDWNVPSPRAPTPRQLALVDAAAEMRVVARVVATLRRAVRAFKKRRPHKFRSSSATAVVKTPATTQPQPVVDDDEYVSCYAMRCDAVCVRVRVRVRVRACACVCVCVCALVAVVAVSSRLVLISLPSSFLLPPCDTECCLGFWLHVHVLR